MNRKLVQFALLLTSVRVLLAAEPLPREDEVWKVANNNSGITLYSRIRTGSSLKEYKAIGGIDAPTTAVHQVLNDVDSYPVFMPFVTECRVVKREGNATFTYQRLSPKICSDRDYTLKIDQKSWSSGGGMAFLNRWQPANEMGPPQKKGVLRVSLCEGSWLLEPTADKRTRATYTVFTDSGGSLPAFISNAANEMAIRRIFTAVRKQVSLPKYADE